MNSLWVISAIFARHPYIRHHWKLHWPEDDLTLTRNQNQICIRFLCVGGWTKASIFCYISVNAWVYVAYHVDIRSTWHIIGLRTEYHHLWHSLAYCNKGLQENYSKCDRLHFAEPFSGGVDLSGFGVDPVFQLSLAWEVSQQRHQLFIVSRLDLPHLLLFIHLESEAEMNYLFSSWIKLSICKPLA